MSGDLDDLCDRTVESMRYVPVILLLSAALFALDFYVYRNWRRFVHQEGRPIRWTLPLYRASMWLMPLYLPLYFALYRWWEVEPKLARAMFFGFFAIYYLPKVPIVLVLVVKDAARAVSWLFRSFQDGLLGPSSKEARAVGEPEPEIGLSDVSRMSRAEFIRRMGWTAAAIPFVATGYGVLRTLYDFSVKRIDVPIVGLPRAFDGMTIAQFSDLHAGSFFSDRPMWDAVSIVNDLKPDLIAVTGDFVNNDVAETPTILPALNQLKAELGVYGCLGNHDHYARIDELVPRIRTTPVELLINAHRTLTIDGAQLHLIGTDNTGFNQHYADLPRAVEGIEPDDESTQILLAHDPSFWDGHVRPDYGDIDLMLCGHTHGGQIGFEFGPLRWSLARVAYDRWAGLYAEPRHGRSSESATAQFLYVNRGIGTVGPPLRLGIAPEITLLTLRRA